MDKNCRCGIEVRSGSLGGVNFSICTECRYLIWEPFEEATFVRPVYDLEFEISNLNEATSRDSFLSWIDSGLQKFGADHVIDREWFVDYYGFDEIEELDIQLAKFCEEYLNGDTEFTVRIVEQITRWDLPRAREESDELEHDIVESKELGQYSTRELLGGAIKDIWREMGEYLQQDRAFRLRDAFAELEFDGTSVVVKNVSWDLENTLGTLLDNPEVSLEIERGSY